MSVANREAGANSCPAARTGGQGVVLLHGLGSHRVSMQALQWALVDAGYHVENISYPSLRYPVEQLAELAVGEGVRRCLARGVSEIHFVTHSLGGILVREYLSRRQLPQLGRVVMLGPPNQGSRLAEGLIRQRWFPRWAPPACRQLGTGDASVAGRLGPVSFELGVLAGNRNRRDWLLGRLLPGGLGPGDGTVAIHETRVAGMSDFIQLPLAHTLMAWSPGAIRQAVHFLAAGCFSHR